MSENRMSETERQVQATYIGGPTVLIEIGGLRLLTDPTFDPAGSKYTTPVYTLRKTTGPALAADDVGKIDAVLLSHDHHFDNFDRLGRETAMRAAKIVTTADGAARLGGQAVGLRAWESTTIDAPDGRALRITATPARHGPPDGDRGPVIGFILAFDDAPNDAVYVSGDTVWYDGVAEVARRFVVRVVFLFMGGARVKEVGPANLTLTAAESVDAVRAFPNAVIVPLHFEGWMHFSEGRAPTQAALAAAGLSERVRWLEPGRATPL
jgi:L-ascorbate metabolism protein UlaG (beta-lactamase superfamily)